MKQKYENDQISLFIQNEMEPVLFIDKKSLDIQS